MKAAPLLTLFYFFLLISVAAPAQTWRWATSGGSDNSAIAFYNHSDFIRDMATDRNGNVYIISTIVNKGINVAGQSQPLWPAQWQYYSREVMINSFTCNGVLRWTKLIGCESGDDIAYALRTDSADGVYAAMELARTSSPSTLHVDTDTVINGTSHKTLYLAKYDTAGVYQWVTGPQEDTVSYLGSWAAAWLDMDADAQGNVYCLMHLDTGAYGGVAGFVAAQEGDYIVKYDRNGVLKGGTRLETTTDYSDLQFARIARDGSSGNYYLAGYNDWKIYVGNDSVTNGMYIIAFDKDGNYLWKRENTIKKGGRFCGRPIVDASGDIYLSGGAPTGDIFNGYLIQGNAGVPLVVKMDNTGKHLWGKSAMSNGGNGSPVLCHRNSGEIVMAFGAEYMYWPGLPDTVNFSVPCPVLTRLNTQTGKVLGMDTTGATYSNMVDGAYATAIVSGGSNGIYVGGIFGDTLAIGTSVLTNSGGQDDFFIARYGYDACSCDTLPQPSFTSTLVTWNAYQFTYTGSQPFNAIRWDFGDGTTSTQMNPFHTFPGGKVLDVTVTVTNDCGDNTFGATFQTVGIGEVETTQVSIFPNPAVDKLTIEGAIPNSTVYVFDIAGRLHQTLVLNNGGSGIVSTAGLPAGQYLLRLSAVDGKSSLHKFIKQ